MTKTTYKNIQRNLITIRNEKGNKPIFDVLNKLVAHLSRG